MKLLTKEITNFAEKYPIHSQQDTPTMDKTVICKFFNPYGVGTWIITEMSLQDDGDWLMYGLAELGYGYELGYISFNELNEVRVNVFGCRLPLEREIIIEPGRYKVKDLISEDELM